jgi:hypothetical protein
MKSRSLFVFIFFIIQCTLGSTQSFEFSYYSPSPTTMPSLIPYRVGNLWGYSNVEGVIVLEPKYKEVNFFYGPLAIVLPIDSIRCSSEDRSCLMLINRKGDTILPPGNYTMTFYPDSTVLVEGATGSFGINDKKERLSANDQRYQSSKPGYHFSGSGDEYYVTYGRDTLEKTTYEKFKKNGYKDSEGNFVLNPHNMHEFKNGFAHLDSSWGDYYSDKKGNFYKCPYAIRPDNYSNYHICPEPFLNGFAIFEQEGKTGAVDTVGNWIAPLGKYYRINNFSDGMALVTVREDGDERIFINAKGVEMQPKSNYYFSDDFHEGYARIEYLKGQYLFGFINKKGKNFPLKKNYAEVWGFSEGLCLVRNDDGFYGFVDTTGKEVILATLDYDIVDAFSDGMCRVKKNNLYGFIDKSGKEIIPPRFEEITSFNHGLAYYPPKEQSKERNNAINKKGEQLPYSFYKDKSWVGGYLMVGDLMDYNYNLEGIIDSSSNLVVPLQENYFSIYPFGLIKLSEGYINPKTGVKYFKD